MRPVCSSAMAVSTVTPVAGAGALLAGETRQLGRTVPKFSSRPRRLFNCSRLNVHDHKCVLQVPRASFFDSRPGRSSSRSASVKNGGDGFFPDVSDDTDEMYDELFKKYGKVVFKSTDQKPPSKEAEEDAESLSFAVEMAKVASDVKAAELKVLFVKPVVYWTRFFIIATAFSFPQINAIGSRMRDLAEQKYGRVATGDVKANSWYLLDFGDVVVHIFLPEQRAFYKLDEFYGNAASIELPFENQPPPSR